MSRRNWQRVGLNFDRPLFIFDWSCDFPGAATRKCNAAEVAPGMSHER